MPDRYWVGGTASWDGTVGTKWATTSGGGGGSSIPTTADNAIFDAASGAVTVTIASGHTNCLNLDTTNFTGTIAGNISMSIRGSLVLGASITLTYTGALTFSATDSRTITSNGKSLLSTLITFDGTGGTWTLQDDTIFGGSTTTVTLSAGTLDVNGKTFSTGALSFNAPTAFTLTLGSSTINLSSTSFALYMQTPSTVTLNNGTSTINLTAISWTFYGNSKTYGNVVGTNVTGGSQIYTNNTFANLTITKNSTQSAGIISLVNDQTVTGTFTVTGNSTTVRAIVQSDTIGTARTITAAAVSLTNCDFMDITGAGAATWTGTSIGDAQGNTGITFTTPVTRYAVAGGSGNWTSTATWSTSSGGASGATVPICHDAVFVEASVGGLSMDATRMGKDIDFTGFHNNLSFVAQAYCYGSLTMNTTAAWTPGGFVFYGRSGITITSNGGSLSNTLTFDMVSGSATFVGNWRGTNTNLYSGTLNANNYNISISNFTALSGTTINMGTGTWTIAGSGTIWNMSSSATLSASTSTIVIICTIAFDMNFGGGGKTYNNIQVANSQSGISLNISDSNTFNKFTVLYWPTIIKFASTSTTTISDFKVHGDCNGKVTIGTYPSSTHNLVKAGGGIVACDSLSISSSSVTPANTWYAGANSTDGGSNSGWIFTNASIVAPRNTYTTKSAGFFGVAVY